MADKEASVFIIDLGASMSDCHNGRSESDLDWSMRYVWDKISTTVAASRKTWTIGVLGLRTDNTLHALQDEDGYENISVLRDIGPMTMTCLKELQPAITPSSVDCGDAISAVVIAVDMIAAFTKKLKYKRRVYLITDATAPMDGDDLGDIIAKINDDGVELIVLYVDAGNHYDVHADLIGALILMTPTMVSKRRTSRVSRYNHFASSSLPLLTRPAQK